VPTLVLDGDMDTIVPMEEVQQVTALFPGSTFIPVAEAGHVSAYSTQCSANLESQFIETLQVGDTGCTKTAETVWPAVGRFPLIAADALPAYPAVATITDALKRATIGSGSGVA
jgi:hypothetical protein